MEDMFSQSDYRYLNPNDVEDMYLLLMKKKADEQKVLKRVESRLLDTLLVYIRSSLIIASTHDFQLEIESYQHRINLKAPKLTFPGIEQQKPYTMIKETCYRLYLLEQQKGEKGYDY